MASGASRANSGIAHAGYDCVPGTLKAKFNVEGNKMMPSLTRDLDVPFRKTGSLVLAGRGGEKGLLELLERAKANGVDARIIDREEIDKIQDGVNPEIVSALYAKDAGIVSPYKLTIALCDRAILNGAEVRLEENIESIRFDGKFIVKTQSGEYESKYLVNSAGVHLVGLFFDMSEVFCFGLFIAETFFVGMEHNVIIADAAGNMIFLTEIDCLRNIVDLIDGATFLQFAAQLDRVLLSHAIKDHVSATVAKDTLHELILPVVIVRETSHRGFYASKDDRYIWEELFQNLGVNDGWIVGTHVMA